MSNGATNNAQVVKLELSVEEVNVVLAGLGELPAKASINVIDKIRSQAVSQLQSAQREEVVAEPVN
jgi:hypothetical protein